jgi:hypothetical protein
MNLEQLVYDVYTENGFTVFPSVDVDSFERLPLVLYDVTGGQAIGNSQRPRGWIFGVRLTILSSSHAVGNRLAHELYTATHSAARRRYGEMLLIRVQDDHVPMQIPTEGIGKDIFHYSVEFTWTAR